MNYKILKNLDLKAGLSNLISEKQLQAIELAAEQAEKFGAAAYLIGGIARDILLNNPVKDIDITIEADALIFARFLEKNTDCRIIAVQENLKTAKIEFKSGAVIDFASSREEYYKISGQLPIAYNFGCALECDVKRRDFTINTLALALTGKEKYMLIDYMNGLEDLNNKKIRILHDKSFIDDPSRTARAAKFQMRLGFDIEEKTEMLMQEYLKKPDKTIPLERIKNELKSYFSIKKPGLYKNLIDKKIYKLISDAPVLKFDSAALDKMMKYIDAEKLPFIYTALLVVNSDFESRRLNLNSGEKKILNAVKKLLSAGALDINNNYAVYKAFSGKPLLVPAVYYLISKDNAVIKYFEELQHIKLLINGKDLINAGYKPSPMFGIFFEELLKKKLQCAVKTKDDEMKAAAEFFKIYSK